jgi:hypothetical protein
MTDAGLRIAVQDEEAIKTRLREIRNELLQHPVMDGPTLRALLREYRELRKKIREVA